MCKREREGGREREREGEREGGRETERCVCKRERDGGREREREGESGRRSVQRQRVEGEELEMRVKDIRGIGQRRQGENVKK